MMNVLVVGEATVPAAAAAALSAAASAQAWHELICGQDHERMRYIADGDYAEVFDPNYCCDDLDWIHYVQNIPTAFELSAIQPCTQFVLLQQRR